MHAGGRRFDPRLAPPFRQFRLETDMAVPKSKVTRSKRGMRRAHDAISHDAYVEDKTTGELHRPHHMDPKTGMYKGRQVLKVKDRV